MSNKPGYKTTQIGEIPEEWEVVKLGDVLELTKNGLTYRQTKEGKYPVTRIETISEGVIDIKKLGYLKNLSDEEIKNYKLEVGDILFSHINSIEHIAKAAIYLGKPELLIHGMNLLLLRPNKERVDPVFLLIYLKYEETRNRFRSWAKKAVNQASINQSELNAFLVPVPPLLEQRIIASILSTVDEAIQETDEIIQKARELKKGLMQQLLTKGIGHTKFKQTEIGEIPEEWEIIKLNEIATDFIGGGTPSTSKPEYWDGDIPWMRSAWIKKRIVDSGEKYITKEGLKNSATNIVPQGNILVATRVCIGNVAINKINIAISQDLTGVVIEKQKALSEYVYWALRGSEGKVKSIIQGSTIKGVLREDLKVLKLPLPPISEQEKIASVLSVVDEKIEKEKQRKGQLEKLKKGLMQDLLTGRVRVKVD